MIRLDQSSVLREEEAHRAARAFGFSQYGGMKSLSPYAPVYRLSHRGKDWVLKRTGYPNSPAQALAAWLRRIHECGVPIVVPAEDFIPNPRKVRPEDAFHWVVYDFIDGAKYTGSYTQIYEAGALLGRIHAAGAEIQCGLLIVDGFPVISSERIRQHSVNVRRKLDVYAPDKIAAFTDAIQHRKRFVKHRRLRYSNNILPRTACTWDYKASNIVFPKPNLPVVIDPDHGGCISRLYDLARAVLLFHCDHESAPHRLWTRKEWSWFVKGYTCYVKLTPIETELWKDALVSAWLDVGLWLLANFSEGWADEEEREFLTDLAIVDMDQFILPATNELQIEAGCEAAGWERTDSQTS